MGTRSTDTPHTPCVLIHSGEWPADSRSDRTYILLEKIGELIGPVSVLCYGEPRKNVRLSREGDVIPLDVITLRRPMLLRRIEYVLNIVPLGSSFGPITPFSANVWALLQCISLNPGYVLTGNSLVILFLRLFARLLRLRFKVVYWQDDLSARMSLFPSESWRVRLLAYIDENLAPRLCDRIMVITNAMKRYTVRVSRVPASKIFVLPLMIRIGEFLPPISKYRSTLRRELGIKDDERVLLFWGDLGGHRIRQLEDFLRAASKAKTRISNLRLLMVGRGAPHEISALKGLSDSLGVGVTFVFDAPRDLIPRYFACADAGIQVLAKASFFNVIIGGKIGLYVASGLPILVPNLEGPKELLDGNGFAYEPDNIDDLAEKIVKIFSEDLVVMSRRSRQISLRHSSAEAIQEQMIGLKRFLEA